MWTLGLYLRRRLCPLPQRPQHFVYFHSNLTFSTHSPVMALLVSTEKEHCTVVVRAMKQGYYAEVTPGFTPRAFLVEGPRGAYTGMRTMNGATGILDLKTHLHRLSDSVAGMKFDTDLDQTSINKVMACYQDPTKLYTPMVESITTGLGLYRNLCQRYIGHIAEAKVISLVWYDSKVSNKIYIYRFI
jgi:hypothetical protein